MKKDTRKITAQDLMGPDIVAILPTPPRKLKFRTRNTFTEPDKLEAAILEYVNQGGALSITGLCLHLGFASRGTLNHHCEDPKPDNDDPIKAELVEVYRWGKLLIENYYEELLMTAKVPTGAIFALKNMGWKDNQGMEVTGKDGGPIAITKIIIE